VPAAVHCGNAANLEGFASFLLWKSLFLFKDLLESNGTSSDLMKFHWHLMAFDGNLWHVFTRLFFFYHVSPSMGIYMDFSEDFIETSGDFPLCHGKIHHFTVNGPVHPEPVLR